MFTGKTASGMFLQASQGTSRLFKTESDYIDWLDYTTKNGHDMVSFYKIKRMSTQYHDYSEKEFEDELAKS